MEVVGFVVLYAAIGALVWTRFAADFRRDYGELARPLLVLFILFPLLLPFAGAVARRIRVSRSRSRSRAG